MQDGKLKTAGIAGGWLTILMVVWKIIEVIIAYFSQGATPTP